MSWDTLGMFFFDKPLNDPYSSERTPLIKYGENSGKRNQHKTSQLPDIKIMEVSPRIHQSQLRRNEHFDSNTLATLAQNSLSNTVQLSHEVEKNIKYFNEFIEQLTQILDSSTYGKVLRQAEEILLSIEQNCSLERKEEVKTLREIYHKAFNTIPEGPGQLTQLDIEMLKLSSDTPENVICINQYGQKYIKPATSLDTLRTCFFDLGYTTIMHSREVKNFEEKIEICDVILIGKEENHISKYIPPIVRDQCKFLPTPDSWETHFMKLSEYFVNNEKFSKLGYADVNFIPIDNLSDQEKVKNFKEQGFQVCVIFVYPEVIT